MTRQRASLRTIFGTTCLEREMVNNVPFGSSDGGTCAECSEHFTHLKKLSEHIKKVHGMDPRDYVAKHRHGGQRPKCPNCGAETRYVSLSEGYKKYCPACRHVAESEAGRIGGLRGAWNKGLTKETNRTIAATSDALKGRGNPFHGKKHAAETRTAIANAKRTPFDVVTEVVGAAGAVLLSQPSEYVDQNSPLRVTCATCGTPDTASLFNIKRCWRCRSCHPIASRPQLEIVEFIRSLGYDVEVSTRDVIPPFEIDVWVPQKNLAIEYHGLYWHSGGKEGVFDKARHRKKYEMCQAKGIRLIQFFSDEWASRGELCESMIRNALSHNDIKLNARDCEVRPITAAESKAFVDLNHISGSTRAGGHFGLFHPKHGLVGVASARIPIQKKWGHVCELARMCFLSGCSVRGGASKLLKAVTDYARERGYDGLLSYVELRHGTGNVYEKCGFKLIGESKINYWYTDGSIRYDRFKFRAQPGKHEADVAIEAGVRAVYGAGNKVYLTTWR